MRFTDTYEAVWKAFPQGEFTYAAWKAYAKAISPELPEKCEEDAAAYDFEKQILPVLQDALENRKGLKELHLAFQKVSERITAGFQKAFGEEPEAEVLLYLGLCNGAGWADQLAGKPAVLLGMEKIWELHWGEEEALFGLVAHELGHLYHEQKGGCFGAAVTPGEKGLFQLYSEGVAMFCEQALSGRDDYYHQDKDGWLSWCMEREESLKAEYWRRLSAGESVQDFFGDWCSYRGRSDVGYFLGCRFVRFLLKRYPLEEMLKLELPALWQALREFSGSCAAGTRQLRCRHS